MRQLQAPKCHWGNCPVRNKTMFLLNESDSFWMFAHECGCTRAVSKPSTREASLYHKYQQDIEYLRRVQALTSSRVSYSLPGGK